MLEQALAYARQGIPVFPVALPSKHPLSEHGHNGRSNDEAQVRAWWTRWPDAAIGMVPLDQNMVVIDVDLGWENFPDTVKFVESLPETRTARTLRGGMHKWFHTFLAFSNGKPFPCIDIRSGNGYVIVPPSAGYSWTNNTTPVWLPQDITDKLPKASGPDENRKAKHDGDDNPIKRRAAIDYLKNHAPVAIQGQGGDNATFEVASELVRNIGISDALALEYMLKYWNDRAQPPWQADELAVKIWNAGEYGKAEMGQERYPTSIPQAQLGKMRDYTARDWLQRKIEPKKQLIGPINTDTRAKLAAPTGIGKTHFALNLAAHVAAGKPFLHWPVKGEHRVMYIDGEMPHSLLQDRLQAAQRQLFMPADHSWLDRLWLYSVLDDGVPSTLDNQAGMDWLIQKVEVFRPDLVIFDNKTALTDGDENDRGQMVWGSSWQRLLPFVKWLTKENVAQIWIDHTENGKIAGARKDSYLLDTEILLSVINEDHDGVQFDLHFGKTRERTPTNMDLYQPGRFKLDNDQWFFTPDDEISSAQIRQIMAQADGMPSGGWPTGQLAKEWSIACDGLSPSAAKRRLQRLVKRGLVTDLIERNGNQTLWRLA